MKYASAQSILVRKKKKVRKNPSMFFSQNMMISQCLYLIVLFYSIIVFIYYCLVYKRQILPIPFIKYPLPILLFLSLIDCCIQNLHKFLSFQTTFFNRISIFCKEKLPFCWRPKMSTAQEKSKKTVYLFALSILNTHQLSIHTLFIFFSFSLQRGSQGQCFRKAVLTVQRNNV